MRGATQPSRWRRWTAVVVALAAVPALLATSPEPEPQVSSEPAEVALRFDDEHPSVVVEVTIEVQGLDAPADLEVAASLDHQPGTPSYRQTIRWPDVTGASAPQETASDTLREGYLSYDLDGHLALGRCERTCTRTVEVEVEIEPDGKPWGTRLVVGARTEGAEDGAVTVRLGEPEWTD